MGLVGCELGLSGSEQEPVNATVNPRTSWLRGFFFPTIVTAVSFSGWSVLVRVNYATGRTYWLNCDSALLPHSGLQVLSFWQLSDFAP